MSQDPQNRLGISLALSTSVVWAIYFLYNTRDKQEPCDPPFPQLCLCVWIFLLLAGIFRGQPFPDSAEGWFAALYVGVFEMGVTFVLWLMAIRLAPSSDRISNLVYLAPFPEPASSPTRCWVKKYIMTTVIGIILLVTGIVIQKQAERDAKKSERIILGIDPGTTMMGYGVIRGSGRNP